MSWQCPTSGASCQRSAGYGSAVCRRGGATTPRSAAVEPAHRRGGRRYAAARLRGRSRQGAGRDAGAHRPGHQPERLSADACGRSNENVPGVTLDDAAGNPFQPNLFYHGFLASPLQGNPQGLAVYLNGARFNQPFGDTVNWDLIPDIAIDRMDLVGSNPVFGLNALGGALSVRMKNGFTYHGGEIDLLGGSFGQYQGDLQYGMQSGNAAAYVAGTGLHEGGWRDLQSSDLGNFYGDLGWRGERGEAHVNVTGAQTPRSTAPGPRRSSCWRSIPARSSPRPT